MRSTIHEQSKAKVNLALHVIGRRADGYHLLDSVVAFADCGDRLSFAMAERDQLTLRGRFASALPADNTNIVMKAVLLLRQHAERHGANVPSVAITLEKNLPVASGIGGGSANAAATLRGLVALLELKIGEAELSALALSLGADVPVCLAQKYCRMGGIGDIVTHLGRAPAPAIVLVNPRVSQPTQAVFEKFGLAKGDWHSGELDVLNLQTWRNDLTAPALLLLPVIADVLAALRDVPVLTHVSMSGSGATCFGLANSIEDAERAAQVLAGRFPDWWVARGHLQ